MKVLQIVLSVCCGCAAKIRLSINGGRRVARVHNFKVNQHRCRLQAWVGTRPNHPDSIQICPYQREWHVELPFELCFVLSGGRALSSHCRRRSSRYISCEFRRGRVCMAAFVGGHKSNVNWVLACVVWNSSLDAHRLLICPVCLPLPISAHRIHHSQPNAHELIQLNFAVGSIYYCFWNLIATHDEDCDVNEIDAATRYANVSKQFCV